MVWGLGVRYSWLPDYACIEADVQRDWVAAQAVEHRTGELDLPSAFDVESRKSAAVGQNKERAGATEFPAVLET